ncbi:hypothetical protein [Micromonospora sicca]|uniref:hypothetical protein n=1 Tax=Micromonospora sicca TaxID=2202420 RepID=UPI0011B53758|nr:hypothetical protein [Micromonospora sp. 4G51]
MALGAAAGGAALPWGAVRSPGPIEELTKAAQRWCAEQGYEVVGEHVGAMGWRAAFADVDEGLADLVVAPSVERLGFGRQVFERIAEVRASGGDVAGPGVRSTRTPRWSPRRSSSRKRRDGARSG